MLAINDFMLSLFLQIAFTRLSLNCPSLTLLRIVPRVVESTYAPEPVPHGVLRVPTILPELILHRLLPQCLAHPLDRVEGAGHLVFILQGPKASLGWVAFGRLFDDHRTGVVRKVLNKDDRVASIDDVSIR